MMLSAEQFRGVHVIRVNAETIEASESAELRRGLKSLLAPGRRVIIDLGRVTAVDAIGLGVLVRWIRDAHRTGVRVCFYNLTKPMRAFFEMLAIHRVISICETWEEAWWHCGAEEHTFHERATRNKSERQQIEAYTTTA